MGMAKLAPTTNAYGSYGSWLPCGYDDRHTSIEGFAHFHEFQIGGVVTIPTTGELKTLPGTLEDPDSGYRSRVDKTTEVSTPGYYAVTLTDYNIKAEITATTRTGFHRYTFPQSTTSRILFDIGHKQGESATITDAEVTYHPETNEVTGWVENYPISATFCQPDGRIKIFFAAKLDKKPQTIGTFIDEKIQENSNSVKGPGCGLYLTFQTKAKEQIQMQVGLSYTNIENARNNRDSEATGKSFDDVKNAAHQPWIKMLSRIQVEGGTPEAKTKFYTGLYLALLGRVISNDINGQYIRHDKTVGQIPLDKNGIPLYSHHNPDGKISMDLSDQNGILRIEIKDQGIGIPDVKKAMEPMFTTKPEEERTGMGFSFMEAFMDQVEVISKQGEGTTVIMTKKIGYQDKLYG